MREVTRGLTVLVGVQCLGPLNKVSGSSSRKSPSRRTVLRNGTRFWLKMVRSSTTIFEKGVVFLGSGPGLLKVIDTLTSLGDMGKKGEKSELLTPGVSSVVRSDPERPTARSGRRRRVRPWSENPFFERKGILDHN